MIPKESKKLCFVKGKRKLVLSKPSIELLRDSLGKSGLCSLKIAANQKGYTALELLLVPNTCF
jgi:hypothetical protein